MTTYTDIALSEMTKAGWEVGLRKIDEDHCVAFAKKGGHTCVAEGDGELGALIALGKSIREVEQP